MSRTRGFRITTAWAVEDGENPWLLSAYDEYTEDAYSGTPDFFTTNVEECMRGGGEVRIVELLVDYELIEARFAATTIDAEVNP